MAREPYFEQRQKDRTWPREIKHEKGWSRGPDPPIGGDLPRHYYFQSIYKIEKQQSSEVNWHVLNGQGWSKEEAIMNNIMEFADREEFRKWLYEHCRSNEGVWLLFGKAGGPKTIKAQEALEEALCFGWIDGQMQSLDDKTYKKYFHLRREKSKWSEKNKALVKELEERGIMTDFGRKKIEEAKANGQWDAPKPMGITEEQIAHLSALLEEYEPAYTNFLAMSPSVKKTYTRAYFDAKTDAGRKNRIAWMVDRLNRNLKPM